MKRNVPPRTEIPSQFIDGHRSPMSPIDGHQWSIDEVFLTMIPKIRSTWLFKISTKLLPFKFFSLFKRCFEDAQILYSEMKLYIVIHIIYLCEKPVSVDFPRKKHQIF